MRCGRCGNENAEGNRFCGMCGAALVPKTQAGSAIPASVSAGEHNAESRPSVPPAVNRPIITGPSFLGLNQPEGPDAAEHSVAPRHRDHLQHSSRNLNYLLEDDEEHRGWFKTLAVIIALGLALGFGYLHWKQGGFDWLLKAERKPGAATQPAEGQPSVPDAAGTGAAATPAPATSAPTTPDATGGGAAPPAAGTSTTGPDATGPQAPPGQTTPVPSQSNPPPDTSPATKPADSTTPTDTSAAPADTEPKAPPAASATPSKKIRAPKPSPVTPVDPITEAERYLYGRGARQDCDRGLRMVKAAAAGQSSAKAMISLGTLYSTGTCTPRDLPTAYRWFALALHKEPDNQALQDDLQKLWSQMTQAERQLAIRLSQ